MSIISEDLQDRLGQMVERGIHLPPMPAAGAELMSCIRRPIDQIDMRKLSELIESDPPLATRLLRVANSPYYGMQRDVTRVSQALLAVGLEEALSILNFYLVRRMFDGAVDLPGFNVEAFWKHSMAVGAVARQLCQPQYLVASVPGELYTAGLLHDIGKIVLSVHLPQEFKECLAIAACEKISLHEAERRTLGFDHAILGGHLLDRWNLPPVILDCVACHHDPDAADIDNREGAGLLQLAQTLLGSLAREIDGLDASPGVRPAIDRTWWAQNRASSPLLEARTLQKVNEHLRADLIKRAKAMDPSAKAESNPRSAADANANGNGNGRRHADGNPARPAPRPVPSAQPSLLKRFLSLFS